MEACNDFRSVNIYPSESEILSSTSKALRKNIIIGKYDSVEQYLDIHFRLLREDYLSCVRKGIQSYRSNQPTNKFDVYPSVKIFKERIGKREFTKIKIPPQDEDSKKFMNGSLLFFTRNNFDSILLAKVVQRNDDKCEAILKLIDTNIDLNQSYVMAECGAYFDPTFNVLAALQNMPTSQFPMEKYIINSDTSSVYIPNYLLDTNQNYAIDDYRMHPYMLQKFHQTQGLNQSQFKAFKAALSQEFVVIQGPPGTGKTFLGVKIVKCLLQNHKFWYKNSPLLVISHKNHALDKFLEGLIPITDSLLRMGGQCRNKKLEKFLVNYEDNIAENNTNRKNCSPRQCLEKMRGVLVVGMTTSFATRWRDHLEELKSPIVIVEEAAEILEGYVVASLTKHCQHVILLGDHLQLQPMTADHYIGKSYGLGVSLFERMIKNGIQLYTLEEQHRMRPEISMILKSTIYHFLTDHDSVLNRSPIVGVDKSVFFLDHRHQEETCNVTVKNPHEAKFLVAFAKYLIMNGYKCSDIVILAAYAGQVQELEVEAKLSSNIEYMNGVTISTLDAFQGQEADIVLLSMVRSDRIGFLNIQNRVCVGLSRARNGFFIVGNMALLAKESGLWYKVKECLKRQNAIGERLPLKCQNHPDTVTQVQSADDFLKVPHGGCYRMCQTPLKCGHQCRLFCHTPRIKHKCEPICKWAPPLPTFFDENRKIYAEYSVVGKQQSNFFMTILTSLKEMAVNIVQNVIDWFY